MSGTNGLQLDSTVGGYLGLEAGDLSLGEIVHARVIGVVHVVADGIKTRAGAGIACCGAAGSRGSLGRGIGNIVTISIASALEGMVEPNPVPDLVSRGSSQVELSHGTAGEGRIENNNSVVLGVRRVVGGEGSITKETLALAGGETDGVEVECAGVSYSERGLHGGLLGCFWTDTVEPVCSQCPGGVHQLKVETSSNIVPIQDVDLFLDLGIRNVTSGDVLGRIDNVEVDWDREVSNSGGQVGNIVTGDEGFESCLLLADGVGSEIITTLATGSPGRNVV